MNQARKTPCALHASCCVILVLFISRLQSDQIAPFPIGPNANLSTRSVKQQAVLKATAVRSPLPAQ